MIIGSVLDVESACPPVPFDGGVSIGCGATVTNATDQAVIVTVVQFSSGSVSLSQQSYILAPGQSFQVGQPPAGSVWVVTWATQGQINRAADWALALSIGVGALAGVGFADISIGLYHWIKRRREYR